jgi:hypothetical protein
VTCRRSRLRPQAGFSTAQNCLNRNAASLEMTELFLKTELFFALGTILERTQLRNDR